jgi:hypothetical protein
VSPKAPWGLTIFCQAPPSVKVVSIRSRNRVSVLRIEAWSVPGECQRRRDKRVKRLSSGQGSWPGRALGAIARLTLRREAIGPQYGVAAVVSGTAPSLGVSSLDLGRQFCVRPFFQCASTAPSLGRRASIHRVRQLSKWMEVQACKPFVSPTM